MKLGTTIIAFDGAVPAFPLSMLYKSHSPFCLVTEKRFESWRGRTMYGIFPLSIERPALCNVARKFDIKRRRT